jgi:hypothetical protein
MCWLVSFAGLCVSLLLLTGIAVCLALWACWLAGSLSFLAGHAGWLSELVGLLGSLDVCSFWLARLAGRPARLLVILPVWLAH